MLPTTFTNKVAQGNEKAWNSPHNLDNKKRETLPKPPPKAIKNNIFTIPSKKIGRRNPRPTSFKVKAYTRTVSTAKSTSPTSFIHYTTIS